MKTLVLWYDLWTFDFCQRSEDGTREFVCGRLAAVATMPDRKINRKIDLVCVHVRMHVLYGWDMGTGSSLNNFLFIRPACTQTRQMLQMAYRNCAWKADILTILMIKRHNWDSIVASEWHKHTRQGHKQHVGLYIGCMLAFCACVREHFCRCASARARARKDH